MKESVSPRKTLVQFSKIRHLLAPIQYIMVYSFIYIFFWGGGGWEGGRGGGGVSHVS